MTQKFKTRATCSTISIHLWPFHGNVAVGTVGHEESLVAAVDRVERRDQRKQPDERDHGAEQRQSESGQFPARQKRTFFQLEVTHSRENEGQRYGRNYALEKDNSK